MLGPLHCLSVAAFIFPNAAMLSFLSSQSIFLELFVADDFGVLKSRVSSRQPRSFSFGKRTQNHFHPGRPNEIGLSHRMVWKASQLARLKQGPPLN